MGRLEWKVFKVNLYQKMLIRMYVFVENAWFIQPYIVEGCKKILRLIILCVGTDTLLKVVYCAFLPKHTTSGEILSSRPTLYLIPFVKYLS